MKTPSILLLSTAILSLAHGYELHEWGTFTTVSGSDGILLSGLQREEEALPPFVHAHFGLENGQYPSSEKWRELIARHGVPWTAPTSFYGKGLGQRPVSGVTVKMETPVIYFHSDTGFRANVKVGFNGGTISQWYPDRSEGDILPEPAPPADPKKNPTPSEKWRIDFTKDYKGSIAWNVEVLSPEETARTLLFKPRESINWMRARVRDANAVRTSNGETEGYLFYRGIGNFKPGLDIHVSQEESLMLYNRTGGTIPYLLVFERRNGQVRWHASDGGLSRNDLMGVPESTLKPESAEFPVAIYQSLKMGLTQSGLLESEADAMIQTWWTSYFESEGLRVFWILPASTTERILPITVTPAPQKTVRVIVGRSEVLRPRQESEWLAESKLTGDEASRWKYTTQQHRFGLAISERVAALQSTVKNHARQPVRSRN
jgi:hypothetical protein